ncbi:PDC [Branchiostoma lanceolatum]|uniref:PDC protein n=1 Tax=Branchiostoma lanceolatum TaxID=7740 RepID=A0A8J9ZYF9_BRALA|nr:PDC [Branchiostoma lanceolatum]
MTTLDDKLLGLKTQYYASSSEDEPSDDEGACSDKDMDQTGQAPIPGTAPEYCQDPNTWQGQATNTGPKGVLEDWVSGKGKRSESVLAGLKGVLEDWTGPKGVLEDWVSGKGLREVKVFFRTGPKGVLEDWVRGEGKRSESVVVLQTGPKGVLEDWTGPKGVLEDWRRFKQLETERRAEQQAEKVALVKKLAFTCRSELNDAEKTEGQEDEDVELDEDFLRWYREQRLREMQQKASSLPTFGNVLDLTRSQYVDAIDKENKYVLIIIHIFERFVPGCDAVNGCFQCLAQDHPRVKFCRIQSSEADVSQTFTSKGLPAILAYRGGQLVANFLRITDQLGDDFFAGDLESFLVEHGLLQSKADVPTALKQSHSQDDDSDFDVD